MNFFNQTGTSPESSSSPRHEEIEVRAFALWQERGAPLGSPEIDWFQAEEQIKSAPSENETPVSALARTIGSALGSVAALVSSLERPVEDTENARG